MFVWDKILEVLNRNYGVGKIKSLRVKSGLRILIGGFVTELGSP